MENITLYAEARGSLQFASGVRSRQLRTEPSHKALRGILFWLNGLHAQRFVDNFVVTFFFALICMFIKLLLQSLWFQIVALSIPRITVRSNIRMRVPSKDDVKILCNIYIYEGCAREKYSIELNQDFKEVFYVV